MCDVESYIYMPMLHETGSIPKHKYLYGPELRAPEERIAAQWRIRTQFRSQLPALPRFHKFAGQHFHTAHWDYSVTGGSPDNPALAHLQGKRIGIIGTAAPVTARTLSSCGTRGQRETDPEEFRMKIATGKGWQFARAENFAARLCGVKEREPRRRRVDALPVVQGARPARQDSTTRNISTHVAEMHALDFSRSERIRARADEIAQDKGDGREAQGLAFNKPTVTLVDTDGCGVDSLTKNTIVTNGVEYPVNVLVLFTGFRTLSTNLAFKR
ncbi:hypothetical protein AURDEDRAFT_159713 [Auricularia subglabra TFB-10046 SS5]|nr:hypothetical protein AURDEDRAFT_159713 [Auricularia subglabra TFB-10046 SS5]